MISLNDWEDILKVQITNTKQGIKTSQRKLPIDEDEDCYPPLLNLFSKWGKLLSVFDPSSTLVLNFDHGLSPKELCDLKNNGVVNYHAIKVYPYVSSNIDIYFDLEISCKSCSVFFNSSIITKVGLQHNKKYLETKIKHKIVIGKPNSNAQVIHLKVVNDYVFDTNWEVGKDIDTYITDFKSWIADVNDYLPKLHNLHSDRYYNALLDLPVWFRKRYDEGYSDSREL